ncbi:hypothetical protein TanjilG_08851 [Lupinus angustifolius]|uniref:Cytokinin hydroxylase-like n=1 Tax=Lupinus angustifolius TaxID=3871 RepID=A0A1J7HXH8_LUPAN|nr:PREDICTED: cytokinin hydroxylase-like [Lupinus angustifolius]OIW17573.1 hypothetical protein TanjilG_08851 [Lupinus angustifolius]
MAMVVFTIFIAILVTMLLKLVYETLSCYWLTPLRINKIMEMQGIHGPKPCFFTGNILDMSSLVSKTTSKDMKTISHDIVGRLLPHFLLWSTQYGNRFLYWNGIEPRLCLTETELIKEFLSKYSTVSGKSWQQRQGSKNFIGEGVLMANGEDWYHQRHIVAPAFLGDRLKGYAGNMVECTKEMLQSIEKVLEFGESEVEIGEYMTKLTADIISRTEFGTSYQKGKKIFHLLTVLQSRCAQASRHLCIPGSRYFPSKYNREIKSLKMEVERLLMEIIQSRKDCVEIGRSNCYGNDLLGMLLNEMMEKKKRGNGKSINLQLVMDECKTFFFAGHETSALLLTWTVMLLATNPIWQHKVRDEVKRVCNGGIPSLHQLSKLTLLHMVINESLRLYPPASVLPRMAFEDIMLGDLYIPKGLSIWIPVLAIHHSQKLWGKDANEFNPERFTSKSFIPGRFLPFASGPRNCVGQTFALMEAKIILAMLVSKFSFTISENYRHAPVVVLTIKPKYGVQVCMKPLEP